MGGFVVAFSVVEQLVARSTPVPVWAQFFAGEVGCFSPLYAPQV